MIRVISKPNEHVAVVVCSVEERGRLLRRRYVCPSRQAQPIIEDVPYVWNHQVVLVGGTIEGREGKSLRLILKVVREAHRPQVGDMVLRRKSWRQPDLVDLRVLHDFSVVLSFHGELGGKLDVGQPRLSKYVPGQSTPMLDILLKLKAYSGKSTDWILTEEE